MDSENHAKNHREPVAAIIAARGVIADPERWTRSAPARRWKAPQKREAGAWVPTQATDPHASRWCAAGALCVVSGTRSGPRGIAYLEAASHKLFGIGIGRANDDRRLTAHADILRCYDVAIAMAEGARERTSVGHP